MPCVGSYIFSSLLVYYLGAVTGWPSLSVYVNTRSVMGFQYLLNKLLSTSTVMAMDVMPMPSSTVAAKKIAACSVVIVLFLCVLYYCEFRLTGYFI